MNYILFTLLISLSALSFFLINDNANVSKINIQAPEVEVEEGNIVKVQYKKSPIIKVPNEESRQLKKLKLQIEKEKAKARAAKERMLEMQESISLKDSEEAAKKKAKPKLKTHKLKYIAHAKVGDDNYMALAEYRGKKVYLMEGDDLDGSKVEKVAPESIIIAGYRPIKNNSFISFSNRDKDRKKKSTTKAKNSEKEVFIRAGEKIYIPENINLVDLSKRMSVDVNKIIGSLAERGLIVASKENIDFSTAALVVKDFGMDPVEGDSLRENTVVSLREISVVEDDISNRVEVKNDEYIESNEERAAQEEARDSKPKQRMVLRSFVSELANNSRDIKDYIYFNRTAYGYRITPKTGFEKVFSKIGFRAGDEVIKVNSNQVFSSGAMMDLLNVSTAKKIKLLIKNGNRYRVVMVNLLKVHGF